MSLRGQVYSYGGQGMSMRGQVILIEAGEKCILLGTNKLVIDRQVCHNDLVRIMNTIVMMMLKTWFTSDSLVHSCSG